MHRTQGELICWVMEFAWFALSQLASWEIGGLANGVAQLL